MSDMRSMWQEQPAEPLRLSAGEIREKSRRFQRTIGWRNAREYLAGLLVILVFGWLAWTARSTVSRAGHGLVVAGMLYVLRRLRRATVHHEISSSCLDFHRRELERQRDLLRSVWKWYLGPLLPGLAVLLAQSMIEGAQRGPIPLLAAGLAAAICAAVFFGIGRMNDVAARRIEEQIRALDNQPET